MNPTSTFKLPILLALFLVLSATPLFAFELVCPPDVTVNCDDELWDLSIYGNAQYHDYSGWHDAGQPWEKWHLNSCGTGYITRKWTVYDPYAYGYVSCVQTITVEGTDLDGSFINWPKTPLDVSGCNPNINPNALPPGYQKPTWITPACAMIGVSYEDKVFEFGGACEKIVRTWTVIDCCNFDPYTGYGSWTFNQEINVTISDVPQIICPGDITAESFNCVGAYVEVPMIEIPDSSDCSENVTVMHDSPYADNPGSDASGEYPVGTTVVTFTADYGCWQKTMCQVKVTVTDDKAPTPYCIYGLAIALMPVDEDGDGEPDDGMVEIWASDFDLGSYDNCGTGEVEFSFSSDVNDKSRIFTCDDVGRNDIEMWVTDQDGNQNYCNTYVKVQNNEANIPDCEDNDDFSSIQGSIEAHYGEIIDNVHVKAIGTEHEFEVVENIEQQVIETVVDSIVNAQGTVIYFLEIDTVDVIVYDTVHNKNFQYTQSFAGEYKFEYLPHYNDFEIQAISLDIDEKYLNKADVMFIQDYINGDKEFTAYQKMAADVNQDGIIDSLDVNILSQIVEGTLTWDGLDDLWHFYSTKIDMENVPDSVSCPEFCQLPDLKENQYKVNMIGFRYGDVTNLDFLESEDDSIDGKATEILSRRSNSSSPLAQVNPNPFSGHINLQIISTQETISEFILFDSKGQIVFEKQIQIGLGEQEIFMDETNQLLDGIYFYHILVDGKKQMGKVIKIH